jgi:hypothetical protein
MNVINIYSKLYIDIGNYFANIMGETNNYIIEKYYDVENQKNVDIVINLHGGLLTNSCECVDNNKCNNSFNDIIPKHLIIGYGIDRKIGLEWKRVSINDDYKVFYKGLHLIPFEQIKQIFERIGCNIKNTEFENILKLYIDCGKNLNLTITYLEL